MSLDRFEQMTQREKDEFSKICNKLMSATYILRDGTDKLVSREYRFIENEFELFSDYLSLGGWKIYKDAQYGIIYVRNVEGYQSGDSMTMIHTPSCSHPRIPNGNSYSNVHNGSQGYLVDVYNDKIIVKGINFTALDSNLTSYTPIIEFTINI